MVNRYLLLASAGFLGLALLATSCALYDALQGPDTPDPEPGPGPGPGPGPFPDGGPSDPAVALQAFGACMDRGDWEVAKLSELALVQTQQGLCFQCHANGEFNTFLNQDSDKTFENSRLFPFVQNYASFNSDFGYLPSMKFAIEGNQPGHPAYMLPADTQASLDEFFGRTLERLFSGACPIPL